MPKLFGNTDSLSCLEPAMLCVPFRSFHYKSKNGSTYNASPDGVMLYISAVCYNSVSCFSFMTTGEYFQVLNQTKEVVFLKMKTTCDCQLRSDLQIELVS